MSSELLLNLLRGLLHDFGNQLLIHPLILTRPSTGSDYSAQLRSGFALRSRGKTGTALEYEVLIGSVLREHKRTCSAQAGRIGGAGFCRFPALGIAEAERRQATTPILRT